MADADFAAPDGPPPPKLPEGWKAVWNDKYKEWFFVNIYTKKSQWDKPTEPNYPPGEGPPDGPPPSYDNEKSKPIASEKTGLSSNNPYNTTGSGGATSSHDISEDEKFARKLQQEEDARAHGRPTSRGAADNYYQEGGAAGYGQQGQQFGQGNPYGAPGDQYGQGQYGGQQSYQQELPPRTEDKGKGKGGFLGKLLGKSSHKQSGGYPQQQGYPQQGNYYGGPPQGQYGYAPQQGYYGQGGQVQQGRRPGGGMGTAGAAALGVGGGLLGGALLADAIGGDDGGDGGGDDGGDFGGDGGGDFGGGDFGGGDF